MSFSWSEQTIDAHKPQIWARCIAFKDSSKVKTCDKDHSLRAVKLVPKRRCQYYNKVAVTSVSVTHHLTGESDLCQRPPALRTTSYFVSMVFFERFHRRCEMSVENANASVAELLLGIYLEGL